jgi:hypothetical protein
MKSAQRVSRTLNLMALLLLPLAAYAQIPALYTKWENFTPGNGMPEAKVFSVAVDGDRVWAGTENGLVLIENSKVAKVYNTSDGLQAVFAGTCIAKNHVVVDTRLHATRAEIDGFAYAGPWRDGLRRFPA